MRVLVEDDLDDEVGLDEAFDDDDWGKGRTAVVVVGLALGLAVTITLAVMIGSVSIPPVRVWQIILHHIAPSRFHGDWPVFQDQIVWQIRLPRVLLGGFVGASLAVVGATLQALVRNPLADPHVFGITSGASVGAVVVILFGFLNLAATYCDRLYVLSGGTVVASGPPGTSSIPSWSAPSSGCGPSVPGTR